ncbi:hypothetical protein MBLNU459_g3637t1 [Dothideomycetes sp. NU459]
MAHPATSAITMAFASPSPSVDTAEASGMNPITAFAASAKHALGMPLTPPNSVSPNLPAHVTRAGLSSPPPVHLDGDIDLLDAVDHAAAQDQPPVPLTKGSLSGLDAFHNITASALAKHHLPAIILGHGPVAIRHVMACLTQSLPGFSRIPPAKARRLVVAALESRAGGGPDGSVVFEKVGWGRWDAHKKGETPAMTSVFRDGKVSPPASESSSYAAPPSASGLQIPKSRNDRARQAIHKWMGSSVPSNLDVHLEDMSMAEHEADKMSLDGSDAPESEDDDMTDSEGDETEEEDWAAIGADALRKASYSTAASAGIRRNYNAISIPGSLHNARRPSAYGVQAARSSVMGRSTPGGRRPSAMALSPYFGAKKPINNEPAAMDLDQTSQEREAIEALLRMGSM